MFDVRFYRIIAITGAVTLAILLLVTRFAPKASATREVCFCHNVLHNPHTICTDNNGQINGHMGHVNNGEDTIGQCVVPTIAPEPSIVPTEQPEVTPTPEVSPEPTKAPEAPQPCRECGQVPSAPMCSNSDTTVAPFNFHILRNGSVAVAKWIPTAGNQVNLYYREVGQTVWTHSVRDEQNDGYLEIGYLNPKLGYEFGLQQKQSCGGGETITAVVIDPPTTKWMLFKTNYYQW